MQAGVTGINSIRVYNPIKQSKENDTDGVFIKKWIPELSKIDHKIIHEPWILTDIDLNGNVIPHIYRKPIISTDFKNSSVRKKLWSLRKDSFVREESKRILNIHVRKKISK
jgi:deoxyribodipyrimidine photo-lyase